MKILLYVEIDVIGIIILFQMLFNLKDNNGLIRRDQKLFKNLLVSNILILVFDSAMWILDGKVFLYAKELNVFVTVIYFILNPICCFLWLIYCEYKLNNNLNYAKKYKIIYLTPLSINIILTVLSPVNGWIFYIDRNNIYSRGNIFYFIPLLSFTYIFYSVYLTIKKGRKKEEADRKEIYKYMIAFPMLPFVGSIIQSFIYGISVIWIFTVISLLMVFINVQNRQIYTDNLTGLNNRWSIEEHINSRIKTTRSEKLLFVIVIDVDKFKFINDTYGHIVGDDALVKVSDILRKSCTDKYDFVGRFGGDEFIIVGERDNIKAAKELMNSIERNIALFNRHSKKEYDLSLSLGISIFSEEVSNVDSFIAFADKEMYNNKIIKNQAM